MNTEIKKKILEEKIRERKGNDDWKYIVTERKLRKILAQFSKDMNIIRTGTSIEGAVIKWMESSDILQSLNTQSISDTFNEWISTSNKVPFTLKEVEKWIESIYGYVLTEWNYFQVVGLIQTYHNQFKNCFESPSRPDDFDLKNEPIKKSDNIVIAALEKQIQDLYEQKYKIDNAAEINSILRSIYYICEHKGEDTNWEALIKRVSTILELQHRYGKHSEPIKSNAPIGTLLKVVDHEKESGTWFRNQAGEDFYLQFQNSNYGVDLYLEIDTECAALEDALHGKEGKRITYIRKLISEFKKKQNYE